MIKDPITEVISNQKSSTISKQDEFSAYLQISTELYCMLDASGNIQVTNHTFQKLLGYAANELIGKPYEQWIFVHDLRRFQKLLSTEKDFTHTYLLQTKGKEFIQIQSRCKSFINNEGSKCTIICSQKLDKYEKSKIHINQLQKEIENYEKKLEQFTHLVSHDLKAPLRSITGFLNLIKIKYSNLLDTNGVELIQFASTEAHKMKIMIEDLTKYSRINSHFQDEIIVDLNEVVEEVKKT